MNSIRKQTGPVPPVPFVVGAPVVTPASGKNEGTGAITVGGRIFSRENGRARNVGGIIATQQPSMTIADEFGGIDIYLFDQLQKGRIADDTRILDAGCGGGRNIVWFLRNGFDVTAIDRNERMLGKVRDVYAALAPDRIDQVIESDLDAIDLPDESFDVVICSAVLHLMEDEPKFHRVVNELWRLLRPGGLFFARLASDIGIEGRVERIEGRVHRLPDGSTRFLVDSEMLHGITERLGGRFADPIKTTVVENARSMTTWVLQK